MKRVFSLILVAVMLFALAACGGGDNTLSLKYIYNTGASHEAIGTYLQQALATVGVNMQLENQEWATFLNTRKNGDYVMARNGWVADFNDPICFLDMWTTASGNNDVQFGKGAHKDLAMYNLDLTDLGYDINVTNGTWAQTYDVLISEIKACTNKTTRYALMHIAEDMLMDTGCIIPLYYYTDTYMIDDAVEGFYSNPLGYKYFMSTTIAGRNSINVCLASEPESLDPALNSAVDGATMIAHLFSGLAKWAKDPATGKLVIAPDCAESLPAGVENSDGTVTYTYTLKAGLKWSNGAELKASDFVYAWNRAASPALAADYCYMFEAVDGYAEMWEMNENDELVNPNAKLNIQANDEARTFTVTLANALPYWDELLAFPTFFPVSQAVVETSGWATEAATYIGNGPYKIASWTHNSVITLQKNENYHDAANVTMPEIKCHLSDDANAMLVNFENGDWQFIDDVPTNEMATLKTEYPTEYVVAGQIGTYYVCFNINANLLPEDSELTGVEAEKAQQEIRKAIGLLFDRNHIVNNVSQAGELPASTFVAMGMTDADGATEFKQNSGRGNGKGYFDIGTDSYAANVATAVAVLSQYYDGIVTE